MTSTPIPTSPPINHIPHPFPWAIKRQRECYSLVAQRWIEARRISVTDVLMISEMFRGFMRYSAVSGTSTIVCEDFVRFPNSPGDIDHYYITIVLSGTDKTINHSMLDLIDPYNNNLKQILIMMIRNPSSHLILKLGLTVGFLTSLSVVPALRTIRPRLPVQIIILKYSQTRLPIVIIRTGMTLTGGYYGAYYGLGLPFERYGDGHRRGA